MNNLPSIEDIIFIIITYSIFFFFCNKEGSEKFCDMLSPKVFFSYLFRILSTHLLIIIVAGVERTNRCKRTEYLKFGGISLYYASFVPLLLKKNCVFVLLSFFFSPCV